MAKFLLSASLLVLATALVRQTEAETTGNSSSLSSDVNAQGDNVFLKVLGHSGKIVIGWKKEVDTDENRVEISLDSLQEVDASGNAVGSSGPAKHSFNTFANQDFTFSAIQDGSVSNLKAKFFTFNSQLKDVNSSVTVTVYILGQDGSITLDGETTPVTKDSIKFSVTLTGWSWCSATATAKTCQTDGAGVLLNIAVKSKKTPEKDNSTAGNADAYSLGYGKLLLSKKIQVDNGVALQNMAAGYPRLQSTPSDAKQIFSFRFPKFTQSINYDPTVVGPASTTSGSSGLLAAVFTVVLTTLLSRLLAA